MNTRDDGPGLLYRVPVYVQVHGNRVVLALDGMTETSARAIKIGGVGASRKGAEGCLIRAFVVRTLDDGYDYLSASEQGLRGDPDTGVIATVILWPVADGNIRAEILHLAAFKAEAGALQANGRREFFIAEEGTEGTIAAADAAAAAARAELGLCTEIHVTFYTSKVAAETHAPGKAVSHFTRGSFVIWYASEHHDTGPAHEA